MNELEPPDSGSQTNSTPNRRNPLDTSLNTGMQGALPPTLIPTAEEIYARVFREIKPKTPIPNFVVTYRRFVNVNSSVRLSGNSVEVRISDILEGAPAPVTEALARILLGKLFRKPAELMYIRRYRLYLNRRDIRGRIQIIRQVRGRKYLSGPEGRVYNLAGIFQKLNNEYFNGLLGQPELGWSLGRSRTMLGHFDPSHNAIIISRIFDEEKVPLLALEYVMFHEMLHLQFPVTHAGMRRCVHTRDFRAAEKRFPRLAEAKEALKHLS